jgi:outer membrane lipoprotein-sorting protein
VGSAVTFAGNAGLIAGFYNHARRDMRKLMLAVSAVALLVASAGGQGKQADLEQVLTLLDKTSASFKSVQTDFEWDQYQKVVDEHDIQKGVMYFKRSGSNVDVAADIVSPEHKKLVFENGKVRVYSFKTRQETTHEAGPNREEFESFLALGFGGRGHDLSKNFDVRYIGVETVDGVAAYKLELTPKSQAAKNMFRLFTIWIDPKTGMSVQQKAFEGTSDYRLAKYPHSTMKINQKLPEDAFKLKTR